MWIYGGIIRCVFMTVSAFTRLSFDDCKCAAMQRKTHHLISPGILPEKLKSCGVVSSCGIFFYVKVSKIMGFSVNPDTCNPAAALPVHTLEP
jgi:hypothetical protein